MRSTTRCLPRDHHGQNGKIPLTFPGNFVFSALVGTERQLGMTLGELDSCQKGGCLRSVPKGKELGDFPEVVGLQELDYDPRAKGAGY